MSAKIQIEHSKTMPKAQFDFLGLRLLLSIRIRHESRPKIRIRS